jgi:hypothetical protein
MHEQRGNGSAGAEHPVTLGTAETEVRPDLGFGAALGVLDRRRRRDLVTTLVDGRAETPLRASATELVAGETDVTGTKRRRVHTSLYHSHVPRHVGVVAGDSIVRWASADRVRTVRRSADGEPRSDPPAGDEGAGEERREP